MKTLAERLNVESLPARSLDRSLNELISLRGKRVLLTGGGGENLGEACAHRLASAGASLAILDLSLERAAATADAVRTRWDVPAHALQGNVTDPDSAAGFVAEAVARLGGLDVLIHSAGGSRIAGVQSGPFLAMTRDYIRAAVDLNFTGVLWTVRAALEVMVPQRRGRIVIVSSEGGKSGLPNLSVYSASKAAVNGFVRSVAHEIGEHGVSIAAVSPGIMLNEHLAAALAQRPGEPGDPTLSSAFARTTLRRCARPEEVASMVAFLASGQGEFVHGTTVSVGGGMSD